PPVHLLLRSIQGPPPPLKGDCLSRPKSGLFCQGEAQGPPAFALFHLALRFALRRRICKAHIYFVKSPTFPHKCPTHQALADILDVRADWEKLPDCYGYPMGRAYFVTERKSPLDKSLARF